MNSFAFLTIATISSLVMPCVAAEPEPDFLLVDENPNSARFGEWISPRQYGEWISIYYFGQET
jgi:hypothetical protein